MSLSVSSRRVLRGAPALATSPTTTTSSLVPALQSLTLSANNASPSSSRAIHTTAPNQWFWGKKSKEPEATSMEKQLTGTRQSRETLVKSLTSRIQTPAIFDDEIKGTGSSDGTTGRGSRNRGGHHGPILSTGASTVREHLSRNTDPDPRSRIRWERKMVIRSVQQGTNPFSSEPRAARIARTERQLTSRSPFLATSTKKLVHLARQIQGKTVAEALVQMRFSKKKFAREVKYQLELARDLAVIERGMGLGSSKKTEGSGEISSSSSKAIEIQDKDGKWIKVDDPTRMYVAEAWVNRGKPRWKLPLYRARGRLNFMVPPSASISVVLKEEKTRIRQAAEREAKKLRHGPWIHLPDRPVTAQRQWYSW